jgi:hypothetical protein
MKIIGSICEAIVYAIFAPIVVCWIVLNILLDVLPLSVWIIIALVYGLIIKW